MAVDERKRHEMYLSLERALGREAADTLMELVPPVGWADVATKQDLKGLEERIELRFQVVNSNLVALEARMLSTLDDKLRKMTVTLATLFVAAAGLVIAAVRVF